MDNLPGGNLSEFFARNNQNYNIGSESELLLPKDKILLVISDR